MQPIDYRREFAPGAPVILRTVGDASCKPGDGSPLLLPIGMKVLDNIADAKHIPTAYGPFLMPADATVVRFQFERNHLIGKRDGYLLSAFIECSIDGGSTWGGAYRHEDGIQIPGSFSMQSCATFGLLEDKILPEAYFEAILPPDLGLGRLVRFHAGAKTPCDVGVSFKVFNDPQPQRQLLKDLHHSVTVDATPAGFASYSAATSLSQSYAGPASPTNYYGRMGACYTSLVAPVSTGKWDTGGTNTTTPSITGALVTRSDFQTVIYGLANLLELVNPTPGTVTNTLANGGNGMYGKGAYVLTAQGVNQSTPSGTPVTYTNASTFTPRCTVTAASTSQITDITAYGQVNETTTIAGNQTLITKGENGTNGQGGGSQYAAGTGSALNMDWTVTCSNPRPMVACACEILQASGGGAVQRRALPTMGVG